MTEQHENNRTGAPVPLSDCGMALAAALLSERWTLLIIREAFYGVRRFGVIRDDIGIPRAALSDRLGKLVAAGILRKAPYRTCGRREHYEYVLTDKGKDLLPALIALMQWGDKHLRDGAPSRLSFTNARTGNELRAAVIDEDGAEVRRPEDIKLLFR